MADLGDLVPLGIQVRDEDGNLANASSVTLTITKPDNTTANIAVDNPPSIMGEYTADYLPVDEGRYLVRWVTQGPAAAFTDSFDIRDMGKRSIISLAEAKAHLNMSQSRTKDDEELRAMIEAATSVVERHRNEIVARRTFVEHAVMGTSSRMALMHTPVISVTSIVDSSGAVFDPAGWVLDGQNGTLTKAGGGWSRNADLVVTYEAGYAQIPAHYLLAAKIIMAHLWQTQRIQQVGPQPTLGGASRRDEQIVTPSGLGFAIPHRAIELLGTRPSIVV